MPRETGHHWRRIGGLRGASNEGVGNGARAQGAGAAGGQAGQGVQRWFGLAIEPAVRTLTDRAHLPPHPLSSHKNRMVLQYIRKCNLRFSNCIVISKQPTWRDLGFVNSNWFGHEFATEKRSLIVPFAVGNSVVDSLSQRKRR